MTYLIHSFIHPLTNVYNIHKPRNYKQGSKSCCAYIQRVHNLVQNVPAHCGWKFSLRAWGKKWSLSPKSTHLERMGEFVFSWLRSQIPGSLFTIFLKFLEFWGWDPFMRHRLWNMCKVRGGITEAPACPAGGQESFHRRDMISSGGTLRVLKKTVCGGIK